MKVLIINMTCGTGSTGRIVDDIADVLEENQDNCYIAYGYYTSDRPNTKKIRVGNSTTAVRIDLLKTRLLGWNGFSNSLGTRKLIKWIDEIQPDLIHLHNTHGGYLNNKMLFDYLKKIETPVVWTLHDCWAFTGHCAYFDSVGCNKWKTGCYNCKNLQSYPKSWLFDRSMEQWAIKKSCFSGLKQLTIVTPSAWLGDLVGESFLKGYPRTVIRNGIDTTSFKPMNTDKLRESLGIGNKKVVLGIASSWSYRKGLQFFIELAKCLDESYQIILIGLTEKQKKRLPSEIIGLLQVNGKKQLAEFYSLASVFVNPTLEDNYPTTNLESQACGTPVITFKTGGSPESIVNGIVTNDKTTEALAEAIDSVCRKHALSGKSVEPEQFSKEYAAIRYTDLYKSIIMGNYEE